MYACLYGPASKAEELFDLALEFSPYVEQNGEKAVLFSIDPLRKLLGSPYQIASEISRAGYERELQANLAIASNPETAILLAQHQQGITLVAPGEEARYLAPLPLAVLTSDAGMLGILLRWGMKTCEDLAALPEVGVAERLGPGGVYLRNLALGLIQRPLRLRRDATQYEKQTDLEHPIGLLEPLLFLFSSALTEICARLRAQSQAARLLEIRLNFEAKPAYKAALEFPVPLTDQRTILKLLQLHLERHPPGAPILAFHLRVQPAVPKRVQSGLFEPPTPLPDKLQITLARIAAMVGKENVGSPQRLHTHRPDAFRMADLNVLANTAPKEDAPQREIVRLVIRIFRPALEARVRLVALAPQDIVAAGVKGSVMHSAGPWKTSGEWWAETAWSREEWDVALDDGALYRIYQESHTRHWFVQGVYD